jgi:hypothetical protein
LTGKRGYEPVASFLAQQKLALFHFWGDVG